jgi:hypothetical protein
MRSNQFLCGLGPAPCRSAPDSLIALQTPMKTNVQLRNVEADDLPLFFQHQRDPIAVAMVAFRSRDRAAFDQHWAKLLADDSLLKKTVIVDGEVAGNIGSWTAEGKREVGTAAWPPRRSPLSSAWNRPGRFTRGWRSTTWPRSASCKNAGSSYPTPWRRHPMTRTLRTFF